jgi:hypothetical protein
LGPNLFPLPSFVPFPDSTPASRAALPLNFLSTSAITSFTSRCTGPRPFARFDVGSLFFAELLSFFKVDLLIF